jgi:Leucine-rich repeat (LRR) protein
VEIAEKLKGILRELRECGYKFDYRFNRGASEKGLEGLSEKHAELLRKYNGFYIKFGESYFKLLSTKEILERKEEKIPIFEINGETVYYPENGEFENVFWEKFENFLSFVKESLTLNEEDLERFDPSKAKGLKRLKIVLSGESADLSFLSALDELEILEVENLEDLEVFDKISANVKFLNVRNLTYLRGFSWLSGLKNLLELRIEGISIIYLKGEMDLSDFNWRILRVRNGNLSDELETLKLPSSMRILEMSNLSIRKPPKIISSGLIELDMRRNGMEDPENLSIIKTLTDLDLSDNRIKSLDWLCSLKNLETLILNNNLLEEFSPPCVLQNLYRLEIKGNSITKVDKTKIPNVRVLMI